MDSFPKQQARTRRFRLGAPANFRVAPSGGRVVFTRSTSGSDPINRLYSIEGLASNPHESMVADPLALLSGDEELPAAERARRERLRETTGGITTYATDESVCMATFALSGRLGVCDLARGKAKLLDVPGPVIDPRIDPTGRHIAWVADRRLWVSRVNGADARVVAEPESDTQTWGLANFLAAEEFDRFRGFWWSPDGNALLAERYDEALVQQWHLSNPAAPAEVATAIRYPAAGTANPAVSLWLIELDGNQVQVRWDHNEFEYLVSVHWSGYGPPLVSVLNREQNHSLVLSVDGTTADTEVIAELRDPCWVEEIPGTPAWLPDGRLLTTACVDGQIRHGIAVDGEPVELAGEFVRSVLLVAEHSLLLSSNRTPTESSVLRVEWDRNSPAFTYSRQHGWNTATGTDLMTVVTSTALDTVKVERTVVLADGRELATIESLTEPPLVTPRVELIAAGPRALSTAVLWPSDHARGSARLPVIMNPYGGPHAQRVLEIGRSYCEAQWLADQGFCVIVADGRGSPGRGPQWEREIFHDLATAPLDDQIDALHAVAALHPDDVDLTRVGITGWSFGGYLAALAVLRRPDVFSAAVAGAPVTQWRLYDTAYTERYLGHPATNPETYESTSLLPLAPGLQRPLMIIHGMADDNVVVAHSLQLSGALTAAGRPHTFLPLSDVTHMTPQEDVAENLLLLEVDFFHRNLRP